MVALRTAGTNDITPICPFLALPHLIAEEWREGIAWGPRRAKLGSEPEILFSFYFSQVPRPSPPSIHTQV